VDGCALCPPDGAGPQNYLGQSRGMCRECGASVEVRYLARGQRVYLQRLCPQHGQHEALVAGDLTWYLEAMSQPVAPCPPPKVHATKHARCPDACGPCLFHGQRCHLPIIPITNACNLRCPICFGFNRPDPYFMPPEEFARRLDFMLDATSGVDLINITGGEPTLHPDLLAMLALAKRPGIGRITLNTNGIVLGRRPELARALADLGIYVVLSLDTLRSDRSKVIHGTDVVEDKLRALAVLEEHRIPTTILHVLVPGNNEDEVPTWLDLLAKKPFVRSLTIQTMTYTGQGGAHFQPRTPVPVDEVERMIDRASGGRIAVSDFMPLPTAHPLCYGVSYLLASDEEGLHPMTRLLGKSEIASMARDGYLLHPSDDLESAMKAALDRLWSEGKEPGLLRILRNMLAAIYPPGPALDVYQRQRAGERFVKTIFVHAHMDEDTYETGRAMRCPDQVVMDEHNLVGACNFNLMYRMPDPLFGVGR
jgi:7,8-dihydro-6-hydroxymethylpterin dimethyltransferase